LERVKGIEPSSSAWKADARGTSPDDVDILDAPQMIPQRPVASAAVAVISLPWTKPSMQT
jgi:hypothetical protein